LGNAVKFTSQGSIEISAHTIERNGDSVLIELAVHDSGIGIAADALDKIFNPFVQEEHSTTRKFGGTGLGLTITHRLVELMGGCISVESTPVTGSCFKVRIPFTVAENVELATVTKPTATQLWDGPKLRVLFVEDNDINIMFGTSLLGKMGHEVVTAENGRDALTALLEGQFDIILMDIQMPVMNGEEALLEIRRQEKGTDRHQPVIALTAYALRGEQDRFMADGFDGYISKPLVIGELIQEMKRVLGSYCGLQQ
ncbi:MAG: ATP-binding protein, partial [Desulfuromonadales bacterium]